MGRERKETMDRQSLEEKGNSANCMSNWDMTAHWLVIDVPVFCSIFAFSICLRLDLLEVSREEDMGMEAARSLFLSLYFFLDWATQRGTHGPGIFTHRNVFSRRSSSSSFILHNVQTFASAPLTAKHLFWLTQVFWVLFWQKCQTECAR